ncbi:MAG TPA: hypothetical protein VGO52_08440, partial [Hyphomonadaceae bacterium]|nr:hypothetical protein [Hyphomonadaceae bacterium]
MARKWADAGLVNFEDIVEAVEALSDGVTIYDADNKPLFINQAHQRRFPTMCDGLANGMTVREAFTAA